MRFNFKRMFVLLTICCVVASLQSFTNPPITQIVAEEAPKAIGPYSQAICAGDYVVVSGQIAIDPVTGKLSGETIEDQTRQALKNMGAILAAQGLTLENVVKTEVYLKDLKDFSAMNKIFGEQFSYVIKPARATVQVSKLPFDALVEISCVAFIP